MSNITYFGYTPDEIRGMTAQNEELRAEIKWLRAGLNEAKEIGNRLIIEAMAKGTEIERLTLENWQLKGALGYEVPGDIPPGNFICGLCDAKTIEVNETRAEVERLRHERECMLEIIADWANEEGIGFDQTTRLSHALGLEPKP